MKARPAAEQFVYLLVILVALAVLLLVAISPPEFLDITSVYQGF